ncbi:MAG TPA: hypothetical protein VK088_10145, partial [Acidimicrobiia bacterium]|nr:hypothetical protein [Acidimicrobiia bacterium]
MSDRLILRAARVVDGTSPEALTGVEVVVADGKITGIVPTGTTQAAPEEIVDLGDRTLMPGLIDLHVHFARTLSEEEVQRTLERPELRLIRSAMD